MLFSLDRSWERMPAAPERPRAKSWMPDSVRLPAQAA
jgi:hypothetical protein